MRRSLRTLLVGVTACTATATADGALAQPAITIANACTYSETQFTVNGTGFTPNTPLTVDIVDKPDPVVGGPIYSRQARTDLQGNFTRMLETPYTPQTSPVLRAVRVLPDPDPGTIPPTLLATAPLTTINRGFSVSPEDTSEARDKETWRLSGLPAGTQLYAHYRLRGRPIARRSLGTAQGPCGKLRFKLRILPNGKERRGTWMLWITTNRTFKHPRSVFLRRTMVSSGRGPRAQVDASSPSGRLY